jgi:hypothetical protein
MTDRDDKKRDHTLRPDWLTKHDPLPLPIVTKRDELQSLARRMIAANAIRRYREDGERGRVSYSRRSNWYAEHPSRFYWPRWFTYGCILKAVPQLEIAGMLVHDQKKPGNRHWQSWFRATDKLMGFETKLQYVPKRRLRRSAHHRSGQRSPIRGSSHPVMPLRSILHFELLNIAPGREVTAFSLEAPLGRGHNF